MSPAERHALVLSEDSERDAPLVAVLRRANLTVLRADSAQQAQFELSRRALDLLVVVEPVADADRVAARARAVTSPSRRAGIVVFSERAGEPAESVLELLANRRLQSDGDLSDFERAITELLAVAPRIPAPTGTRMRVTLHSGEAFEPRLEDLSVSGALLRMPSSLPVGTLFGFALELPSVDFTIRGRGQVVREASRPGPSGQLVAARFLALGGEAPERLAELVERTRPPEPETLVAESSAAPGDRIDTHPGASSLPGALLVDRDEVERSHEELAELTPILDRLLERGLTRRLRSAEWYVTGAELGLESLRAFSEILASIYEDRAISADAERRLADLVDVRRRLADFGLPGQDVEGRVRILLELRPALERLLRELAETGAAAGTGLVGYMAPGVVSLAVADIQRLVGVRHSLEQLAALLDDLARPLLRLSGRARRGANQIVEQYGPVAAAHGIRLDVDRLRRRRGVHEEIRVVRREERGIARRLAAIHRKAFSLAFRRFASDDLEADLVDPKLRQVLVDTLAAGSAYLARAYGAYRHALEVIDADPALIDRVERLGATLSAAARADELVVGAATGPSTGERAG